MALIPLKVTINVSDSEGSLCTSTLLTQTENCLCPVPYTGVGQEGLSTQEPASRLLPPAALSLTISMKVNNT